MSCNVCDGSGYREVVGKFSDGNDVKRVKCVVCNNADNNVVPFIEEEVRNYLDECIRYWRKRKADGSVIAMYYIDAFQSVRMSIFGELLKKEE